MARLSASAWQTPLRPLNPSSITFAVCSYAHAHCTAGFTRPHCDNQHRVSSPPDGMSLGTLNPTKPDTVPGTSQAVTDQSYGTEEERSWDVLHYCWWGGLSRGRGQVKGVPATTTIEGWGNSPVRKKIYILNMESRTLSSNLSCAPPSCHVTRALGYSPLPVK